ncbi:MAG TPA: Holliday junction resolvase RuvX [Acidobacteriota bacterium]|nr:Holliday junction resolvase RuvX [Acidobacteriota bacterium]
MGPWQQGETPPGRCLGLDVGSKRVGVAISDPLRLTARPLTTLRRTSDLEEDARRIARLARREQAAELVVGRPRHLHGRPSSVLEHILPLARQAARLSGLPLKWAEERLSSKEAEHLMAQAGVPPRERRGRRDEFAAAVILQWYFEEGPVEPPSAGPEQP